MNEKEMLLRQERMGAPVALAQRAQLAWTTWLEARLSLSNCLEQGQLAGLTFHRAYPIGDLLVDFCCPISRIVVETDGDRIDQKAAQDEARDAYLQRHGFRLLRYHSTQVRDQLSSVLISIEDACAQGPEAPTASDATTSNSGTGEDRTWAHVTPATRQRAQELRRFPTEAEAVLWEALRAHRLDGLKFRRQHPIGPFIADFYCHPCRLVIEIDGDLHDKERDAARTSYLQDQGYRVIRFWNREVLEDLPSVLQRIKAACVRI